MKQVMSWFTRGRWVMTVQNTRLCCSYSFGCTVKHRWAEKKTISSQVNHSRPLIRLIYINCPFIRYTYLKVMQSNIHAGKKKNFIEIWLFTSCWNWVSHFEACSICCIWLALCFIERCFHYFYRLVNICLPACVRCHFVSRIRCFLNSPTWRYSSWCTANLNSEFNSRLFKTTLCYSFTWMWMMSDMNDGVMVSLSQPFCSNITCFSTVTTYYLFHLSKIPLKTCYD